MKTPPWWVRMSRTLLRRVSTVDEPGAGESHPLPEEAAGGVKVVVGLGNPGSRYDATRHNVGWWAADRLADDWGLGGFEAEGAALVARGSVASRPVVVVKPTTYMNRSGGALARFLAGRSLDPSADIMVLVDDATRPPGGLRLRGSGSAGGHNGLKSLEALLGTGYPRLRIGVGSPPAGVDLASWVLDSMPSEDEDLVLEAVASIPVGLMVWMEEGLEAAMNRLNR